MMNVEIINVSGPKQRSSMNRYRESYDTTYMPGDEPEGMGRWGGKLEISHHVRT